MPIVGVLAIVAGIAGYRLRHTRFALALVLVAALALAYAVIWTTTPE